MACGDRSRMTTTRPLREIGSDRSGTVDPSRPAGARRRRRAQPGRPVILRRPAAVAQLARASACHAEGRGFESLQPLPKKPRSGGVFCWSASLLSKSKRRPGSILEASALGHAMKRVSGEASGPSSPRLHASRAETLNQHLQPGPSCSNGILRLAVSRCSAFLDRPRYSAACLLSSQRSGTVTRGSIVSLRARMWSTSGASFSA